MTKVSIRAFTAADADAVRRVVGAAFHPGDEAELVERIRTSEHYVAEMDLVAIDGDALVGHVMVSRATITADDGRTTPIAMLAPLAVAPERQRHGIGGSLVRAVSQIADRLGEPVIVLEGSPAYYSQFGFEPAAGLGISMPLPDWAPPEAAQVLRLSGYDPDDRGLRGNVSYPAAFDGFE